MPSSEPRRALPLSWVLGLLVGIGCVDAAPPLPDAEAPDAAEVDATEPDGGEPDAGAVDLGDAAPPDATEPDAGSEPDADGPDAVGAPDATEPDAGAAPDAAEPDAAGPDAAAAPGPARYVTSRSLSPITPSVADRLRGIVARAARDPRVFMKVGASSTQSTNFMTCFAGPYVDVDGATELLDTIAWFRAGDAAGTDPFRRESETAVAGWHAGRALSGSPSPLEREISAIDPWLAVVMYGTNDLGIVDIDTYAANMLTLTDQLIDGGIVPVLTSIMPRDDSAARDADVPRFNAVVRAIAEVRQIPFIDLHREVVVLPDHGIGPDDVHLSVYRTSAGARTCVFTPEGLQYGYNLRNWLTIRMFDAVRRVVLEGAPAPDLGPSLARAGQGTAADPIAIDALPFHDLVDTRVAGTRGITTYTGCGASQNEGGPEVMYRLTLSRPTRLRATVLDRGDVDVDVHLLDATGTAAGCLARNDRTVSADLGPGTYHLSLDTFVSGGTERGGQYLLVVMEE